jgi:hypothetical protein
MLRLSEYAPIRFFICVEGALRMTYLPETDL